MTDEVLLDRFKDSRKRPQRAPGNLLSCQSQIMTMETYQDLGQRASLGFPDASPKGRFEGLTWGIGPRWRQHPWLLAQRPRTRYNPPAMLCDGFRWGAVMTHQENPRLQVPATGASLVAQSVKRLPAGRETRVPSLAWEDPLEKAVATHSSILAWKISWTEEPGGLQSMGLQRVGHSWATTYLFPTCRKAAPPDLSCNHLIWSSH